MKPQVTEKQWLEATNIHELHLFWTAKKQYRKWRLFGVACCRRAMALTPDLRFEHLAECAEKFADGAINWGGVKVVRKVMSSFRRELGDEFGPNEVKYATLDALDRASRLKPYDALGAVHEARHSFAARVCKGRERDFTRDEWDLAHNTEENEQMALAHDIFGNPFRHVSFSPEWRTSTVVSIARSMYDSRDFSPMPILADALQDAGCEHEDILAHCRDANGTHVRGCWVVDLVLGKS